MTKEKWIELFKLINDRVPNEKEIAEALKKGEFTVEQEDNNVSNGEDVNKDTTAESITNVSSTISYPSWLIETLKHPSRQLNAQWYYPVINILISSILLSVSLGQLFWRVLKMLIDTPIAGKTINMEPNGVQIYTLLVNSWKSLTSLGTYFYLILLFFLLQIIILLLPLIAFKLTNKNLEWKTYLSEKLGSTSFLILPNILLILCVLFIPSHLIVAPAPMMNLTTQIFYGLDNLIKQIPGLNNLIVVFIAFLLLRFLYNFILLIIGLMNINESNSKIDVFYIRIIYITFALFLIIFTEKFVSSSLFSIILDGIRPILNRVI